MGGEIPFGQWRVTDIVKDSVERFRETRLKAGAGVVGVNRSLRTLRALFNWAIGAGHLEATPFKRAGVVVVKLEKELECLKAEALKKAAALSEERHKAAKTLEERIREELAGLNMAGVRFKVEFEAAKGEFGLNGAGCDEVCSMCGKYCAMKVVNEYLRK
jgi:site-specific recombinase XerD